MAKIRDGLKVGSENERGEYWTIPGKVKRPLAETGNSNWLGRKRGKGAKSCQCFKVQSHADWTQKNFSNISSTLFPIIVIFDVVHALVSHLKWALMDIYWNLQSNRWED